MTKSSRCAAAAPEGSGWPFSRSGSTINSDAQKARATHAAQETEAAYVKILESSQTLLTVLKKESANIARRRQPHGESALVR